jgi:hypothetical protein
MTVNRSFVELNRAATDRMRVLGRLSDEKLRHPVGEHWTVAITLAHLAFWDRRVLNALDALESSGVLDPPEIDIAVNDLFLPFWVAIPPREAARIAVETAEAIDARLENYPPALLEQVYNFYPRWVVRADHRNEHLDEADRALAS